MTEATDNEKTLDQATLEEVTELIREYEAYRERLVSQTTEAAKKAKVSKAALQRELEPQLAQIDPVLQRLREREALLKQSN
ncbi:MAG: hypothetical protein ACFBSC_06930 [Microcoleaceae cyanobacterium]